MVIRIYKLKRWVGSAIDVALLIPGLSHTVCSFVDGVPDCVSSDRSCERVDDSFDSNDSGGSEE